MMYRVIHEKEKEEVVVIGVTPNALNGSGVLITDGNAASEPSRFYSVAEGLKVIRGQRKIIQSDWWNEMDGSKRKIMAECLVPGQIKPELIHTIFVANLLAKQRAEAIVAPRKIPVVPEPHMFFQPRFSKRIGSNISLIDGDMSSPTCKL